MNYEGDTREAWTEADFADDESQERQAELVEAGYLADDDA